MALAVAIQMDPIESINIDADSTFALALEAQRRGHSLFYYLPRALTFREGKVSAVHDVSDGGLLVAVAEMALASGEAGQGRIGAELFAYEGKLPQHAVWFGEDQGRYVLAMDPGRAEEIAERARLLALPARIVGRTGGEAIVLKGEEPLALSELAEINEAWLPGYMAGEL